MFFRFVTGIYVNRKQASHARKYLPETLKKAWPLTFANIQMQIRYSRLRLRVNNLSRLKRKTLNFALRLHTKKIPYKWGGKTEE